MDQADGRRVDVDIPIQFWGRGAIEPFLSDFIRVREALMWRVQILRQDMSDPLYEKIEAAGAAHETGDLDAALVLAYLVGRTDAQKLLPLINVAHSSVRNLELGPQAVKSRAQLAGEPMRACARRHIADNGSISRHRCAQLIANECKTTERVVMRQIAELFELDGTTKRYRPRAI